MLLRGRHYKSGRLTDLRHEGRRIVDVESKAGEEPADRQAGWIAPALFDLQINGCLGIAFNSPTLMSEQVRTVVDECRRHGIAGLLPTLITNSFDALAHGFATVRQACESDPVVYGAVPGFHLEGPYISPKDGPKARIPRTTSAIPTSTSSDACNTRPVGASG